MNDITMNSSANGQNHAYSGLQSAETSVDAVTSAALAAERGSYTMDFSEVFEDGPEITVTGNTALLGRYLGWGSGHVIVDADGTRHMKIDSYTQVDIATGTVTKAACADFFASSGDNSAAASLRSAVSFSAGYLPGQLQDTLSAISDAYRAQREQSGGSDQELDHRYEQGKDIALVSFAKSVGGFLDQYLHAGQQDKIYQSAKAVAAALEGSFRSVQSGPDGLYTLEELDFAAVSVNTCKTILENAQQGDGVRQLLYLNRLELETRSMAEEGQIGDTLADLLCSAGRTAFRETMASLEQIPAQAGGLDLRG